jgi:hypothetical protein
MPRQMQLWKKLLLVVAVVALAGPAGLLAQSKNDKKATPKKTEKPAPKKPEEKKETFELSTQGVLGAPAKGGGDFYEFSYASNVGKKGAKKVWIKIDSGTALLHDRSVGMEAFKEGEPLYIFGKPHESDSKGAGGAIQGKGYKVIQAARVVIGGKNASVNSSYSDPKDQKFQWCEATVEKAGPSPSVLYDSSPWKLTLDRGAAVFQRSDGDLKRDVRKGARAVVMANGISEKPAGDEDRPAFKAERVIVMEPRLLRWYEALLH